MKSLLLVVMGLLLISSVASAAECITDDATFSNSGVALKGVNDTYAFTQNNSTLLNAGTGYCGNVILNYNVEQWNLRRFSPVYEWGLDPATPLVISGVDWGVRRYLALGDSVPQPYTVDVSIYTIPETDSLLDANMTLIETVPFNPPVIGDNIANQLPVHTVFNATIIPNGVDVIVSIHYPAGYVNAPATRFAPSGNSSGSHNGGTVNNFYRYEDLACASDGVHYVENLTQTTQLVIVVDAHAGVLPDPTGACCVVATGACTITTAVDCLAPAVWRGADIPCNVQTCPIPVPTETKSWGQVKSLYR